MNYSELPLFGGFPRQGWIWGLRGLGNDLAGHSLKKPNDSCLSGLWKAAAPSKK